MIANKNPSECKPGQVLRLVGAHDDLESGYYVYLGATGKGEIRLSMAGEDEDGNMCASDHDVMIGVSDLDLFRVADGCRVEGLEGE